MRLILATIATLIATPALADAPLFILDQTQLPFDLGPGNPLNSPASPGNSPYSAWNSGGNTSNTAGNYENRPSNPPTRTG